MGGVDNRIDEFADTFVKQCHVFDPTLQPAGAGFASFFRPQQPAPKLRTLLPAELGRKCVVRRIEQMMAFVKYQPRRY